ncbi:MAG: aminotransferase class V-fold PLP-dependent enzyme, partial [Rhodothalassiaceae bacterium]
MTEARIYLDHNATSPLCAPARAAMAEACELFGNPSSVHSEGRAAHRLLDVARERVAALLSAEPGEIVFTSGGTEANSMALQGTAAASLVISSIEHPSVREVAQLGAVLGREFA